MYIGILLVVKGLVIHRTHLTLTGGSIELSTIECSIVAQRFGRRSKSFYALTLLKAATLKLAKLMV